MIVATQTKTKTEIGELGAEQLQPLTQEGPEVTYHYAVLPKTTLHYIKCGQGAPLIMVPATVSRIDNWLSLAQMMAQHFTVYFFELPGHGKSTPFEEKFTSELVAETVEDFIDQLGYEKVSLMGFSFGGILAMKTLYRLGDRIEKVILLAPALAKQALTLSSTNRLAFILLMKIAQRNSFRRGFLRVIHSPRLSPLFAKALKKFGNLEKNVSLDEVFQKINDTTCEVLSYQFGEIMNLELPLVSQPFLQPCYFAMSIYDPILDFTATLEAAHRQFSNVEVKTFTFAYHQPPERLNFQQMVQQFGHLLEVIAA